jgi:hypothetical protein
VGVTVRLLAFTGLVPRRTAAPGQELGSYRLGGAVWRVRDPVVGHRAATWLAEGRIIADAMAAADLGSMLFAASRLVHLGAIIAALDLDVPPGPNAYIRATRRTRAERK